MGEPVEERLHGVKTGETGQKAPREAGIHVHRQKLKTFDARHKKTELKVFVVVIPKEGLAGWGPTNPSLGMTPTREYL